jgi:cell wall-associated NlpC family hydrolase
VSADQISTAKLQAQAIVQRINQLGSQIAVLSERYDEAQTHLTAINNQISAVQHRISEEKTHIKGLQRKMVNEAITAFTQSGASAQFLAILQGSATDVSVSQEFMNSISSSQQTLVIRLQQAQSALASEQVQLKNDHQQATSELATAGQLKTQAQSAMAAEQSQLSSQNSLISHLIAQAQAAAQSQRLAKAQQIVQRLAQESASSQQQQAQAVTTASNQTPAPTAISGGGIGQVLATAEAQLGKPYSFGGAGPSAFDCSGLVAYAFRSIGVYLPHNAAAQYDATARISYSQLQPGDLVFYEPGGSGYIDHVAIYVGGGRVLEADTYGIPVEIDPIGYVGNPVGFGQVQ